MDYLLIFATLLCASWLNLVLFTLQVVLSIIFLRKSRCSTSQRFTVIGCLIADTVCTVTVCCNAFLYTILFPSKGQFPSVQLWPLPVTIISTAFSSLFEQSFLMLRYWRLSRNIYVTTVLSLVILTHMTFAFMAGIFVAVHPEVEPNLGTLATTVNIILAAVSDFLIAIMLVITIHLFEASHISTRQFIRRVSFVSMSAGILCAVSSTTMLVLFLKQNPVFNIFFSCLGRIYSLTVLINFFAIRPRTTTVYDNADMSNNPLTHVTFSRFQELTLPEIRNSLFIEMESAEQSLRKILEPNPVSVTARDQPFESETSI